MPRFYAMIADEFTDKNETSLMTLMAHSQFSAPSDRDRSLARRNRIFSQSCRTGGARLEPKIAIQMMNQARIGLENMSWTAIGLITLDGNHSIWSRAVKQMPHRSPGLSLHARSKVSSSSSLWSCITACKFSNAHRHRQSHRASRRHDPPWPEPLLSSWRRWFFFSRSTPRSARSWCFLGSPW